MSLDPSTPELTILMPCLNEAEAIGTCIKKAFGYLERSGAKGEVLIADNGSTDGSQEIARELGARVVPVAEKGYGAALIGGIAAARGRFIIMGDADNSYDFSQLDGFLAKLREVVPWWSATASRVELRLAPCRCCIAGSAIPR